MMRKKTKNPSPTISTQTTAHKPNPHLTKPTTEKAPQNKDTEKPPWTNPTNHLKTSMKASQSTNNCQLAPTRSTNQWAGMIRRGILNWTWWISSRSPERAGFLDFVRWLLLFVCWWFKYLIWMFENILFLCKISVWFFITFWFYLQISFLKIALLPINTFYHFTSRFSTTIE